jgi:predicted polyphosphate/ATP-dependent NAD kinase
MRTRKNELDVDFLGGEGPLTKEQEKLISDFIKRRAAKKGLTVSKTKGKIQTKTTRKLSTKKKVTA